MAQSPSFFSNADPYSLEAQRISRARKIAEALQQGSQTPIDPNRMAGGWVVPITKTEGLAKIGQALAAGFGQNRFDQQERELGDKYKKDLADTLKQAAGALSGTPAKPAIDMPPDELGGGPARPAQAAVAPDTASAASIMMNHPATMQTGLGMLTADAQRKALIAALSGVPQAQSGAGSGAGAASPTGAQPPAVQVGGPAGGIPMAAWLQIDPSGKQYLAQLAKDNEVKIVTEGGAAIRGDKQIYSRPKLGENVLPIMDAQGNVVGVRPMPGAAEAAAGQTSAIEGAKAGFDMVQVPVTNQDGTRGTQMMPRSQAAQIFGGQMAQQPVAPMNERIQVDTNRGITSQVPQQPQYSPEEMAVIQRMMAAERSGQPFNEAVPQQPETRLPQTVPGIRSQQGAPSYGFTPSEADQAAAKERAVLGAKREFNMAGISDALSAARGFLTPSSRPPGIGGKSQNAPTQSMMGTALDYAGSVVGYTPRGAKEADQLRAIGAQLVAKMPRMEGPQSDRDAILYREAAGRIGDSTLPADRRLAALDAVEQLYSKYDQGSPQSPQRPNRREDDKTTSGITNAQQRELEALRKRFGIK